jgi:predicted transglutaminase-like cysteine proteinase
LNQRLDQLFAQGNSAGLINRLAEDAQELAILRSVLRGQVQSADSIVVKYCRIYDRDGGRKTMQSSTKQFAADVNEQLSRLDQTVKDLLQFVCILIMSS